MSFPALTSIPSQLTDVVISKMRTTAFFRMRRTCKHFNNRIEKKKEKFRKMIPVERIELRCDEDEKDWKQCVKVISNKLNPHCLPDNFQIDDLCRVKVMLITIPSLFLYSRFIEETLKIFFGRVSCRVLECEVEGEDALAALVTVLNPSVVTVKWVYAPRRDILSSPVFENIQEIELETDGYVDILCCHPNVQYLKVISENAQGDSKEIAKKLGEPESKLKRVLIVNQLKIGFVFSITDHAEMKSVLTIYNGDTFVRAKSSEDRSELDTIMESVKRNNRQGRPVRFEDYDTDEEFDQSLHSHYTEESFNGSDRSHLSDSSFL